MSGEGRRVAPRSRVAAVAGLLVLVGALVPAVAALVPALRDAPAPAGAAWARARLLDQPLAFEPNLGQHDPSVRFTARAPGYQVFLTADEAVAVFAGGEELRLRLEGAGSVQPEGRRPQPGVVSSFVGSDPDRWRSGVATFGAVEYPQVVPGVDLVFYGSGRQLEYDLVVAPGVDPSSLTMAATGTASRGLRVGGSGDLLLGAGTGPARLRAPHLFQDLDAGRREVPGSYVLRGEGRFGFAVGDYDRSRPLVIDPVLVYSSYVGGSSTDTGYDVAVDAEGNTYITGYTESTDFPVVQPLQAALARQPQGSRTDMIVAKIRPDGSGLAWSTYLGGQARDAGFALAVGPDGSVFVTGYTESADFPVAGPGGAAPVQRTYGGGPNDAVVVKLRPEGTLAYSTFLGGKANDVGSGVAVDAAGSVYVVGLTGSIDFPVVRGVRTSLGGSSDVDGFVTKLDPAGTGIVYSTYLGGSGDDQAVAVAVDLHGNAYVTGDTRSSDFPTVRAVQPASASASSGVANTSTDAFLTKIAPDGSALVYSTYLGGGDSEKGTGVAVDVHGNAYVTGNTGSSNFPVLNPAQARKDGDFDAFLTKVAPEGAPLVYSTFLGGSMADGAEAVAVSREGRAWVVGTTVSTNFPTVRPVQGTKGGGFVDAFLAEYSANGSVLLSSTYIGGRDDDQGAAVAVDATGLVTVVGYTNSPDFPLARAFQSAPGGGVGDAFVLRLQADQVAGADPGAAAPSRRDERVRLWAAVTGSLLAAAVLHSIWLRRREAPAHGGASPADANGARPLPGGGRRRRDGSRAIDGRAFGERTDEKIVSATEADDDLTFVGSQGKWLDEPPGEPAAEPAPGARATNGAVRRAQDEGWPQIPAAGSEPDDRTEPAPRLRLAPAAPEEPVPVKLNAPDLLEGGPEIVPPGDRPDDRGRAELWTPRPSDTELWLAGQRRPAEAGAGLPASDVWVGAPGTGSGAEAAPAGDEPFDLAPAGAGRSAPAPAPTAPRPEAPAPEWETVEVLEGAWDTVAPAPVPPRAPSEPSGIRWGVPAARTAETTHLAAAAAADLAALADFDRPASSLADRPPPPPSVGPPVRQPEPEPEAPAAEGPDFSELLSEDLPIPEGSSDDASFSIADLLDEDMAIPSQQPAPAPHPYGELFAPDPDDPLVQATRAHADEDDPSGSTEAVDGEGGSTRERRRRGRRRRS